MAGNERESQNMPTVPIDEDEMRLHISLTNLSAIPESIKVSAILYDASDPGEKPKDPEIGISMEYSYSEIFVLGEGDIKFGCMRIFAEINTDTRTLVERALDPRRPLQDVIDLFIPPQVPQRPN